jgi:hypothetical protein
MRKLYRIKTNKELSKLLSLSIQPAYYKINSIYSIKLFLSITMQSNSEESANSRIDDLSVSCFLQSQSVKAQSSLKDF